MEAILFDLDGTLLPFELDAFMSAYFRHLVPHLAEVRPADEIAHWMLGAMQQVVENESPLLTNEEKFRKALFGSDTSLAEQIWPLFVHFYETSFEELRHLTRPTKIAREICRTVQDKGYRIALATNPIFPGIATAARMRWAGIDDIRFDFVTTLSLIHI